jgi:hypothetical protein
MGTAMASAMNTNKAKILFGVIGTPPLRPHKTRGGYARPFPLGPLVELVCALYLIQPVLQPVY